MPDYITEVRVEARQLTVDNWKEVTDWCRGIFHQGTHGTYLEVFPYMDLPQVNETERAHHGDYVARDEFGVWSVIPAAIFEANFRLAQPKLGETIIL